MDLLFTVLGIVLGIFTIFIMIDESLKMVEKVVGSAIFSTLTIICVGGIMFWGIGATPHVLIGYQDIWDERELRIENDIRIETKVKKCKVTFDVDVPYTFFVGKEYTRILSGDCGNLSPKQVTEIEKMKANFKE